MNDTTQIAILAYSVVFYHVLVFSYLGSIVMQRRGYDQKTWCGVFLLFQPYATIYIFLKGSLRKTLSLHDKLSLIGLAVGEIVVMSAFIVFMEMTTP